MIKKKYILNLIFSLVIIFLSIFSSYYLSVKVVGESKVLMEYVVELRDQSNILTKLMKIAKKKSVITIKKYIQATIDSMIEYDRLPLVEDIKNSFLIVAESLDKDFEVVDIIIDGDKMYIECIYQEREKMDFFIKKINDMKYVEKVFKQDFNEGNKTCILGIECK